MYEDLNKELSSIKEKLRRKRKLESMLKKAEFSLENEMERVEFLKDVLNKEELDVKKLEGMSIKAIFHNLLGDKEERLDKEKQEYFSAKLKYDECCNTISLLKQEINLNNEELNQLYGIENEHSLILKRKEELILKANDDNYQNMVVLMDKLSDVDIDLKEFKEAIDAGRNVLCSLENSRSALEEAEGWGTWDMLGGGFLSTSAKHSCIDEAMDFIKEAQGLFDRFKRELSDVKFELNLDIGISSFDRFADYFFDGIIADWAVQNKINDSLDKLYEVINNIIGLVGSLELKYTKAEEEKNSLEKNIKSIIENA